MWSRNNLFAYAFIFVCIYNSVMARISIPLNFEGAKHDANCLISPADGYTVFAKALIDVYAKKCCEDLYRRKNGKSQILFSPREWQKGSPKRYYGQVFTTPDGSAFYEQPLKAVNRLSKEVLVSRWFLTGNIRQGLAKSMV
ncbi:hypothetical protein GcM3_040036 [Golovinomyces cichoracearum]|uniref:Secreted effector protein n=1 Tax=Golovinomyces cichoracearum TaxID=62708 RepID=A0A420J2E0_9PEZI|nr:hypothetical protein GcM3_040036 [Golovinomyces cichoracearum]